MNPTCQSVRGGDLTMLNNPLIQLVLARTREFCRTPEAVFWVYLFPLLLAVGLGAAFRNRPIEKIVVDVRKGCAVQHLVNLLTKHDRFVVRVSDPVEFRLRLRTGKTSLVIATDGKSEPSYEYFYDPTRPDSVLARQAVDDVLQRAAGRVDPVAVVDNEVSESGYRYIDFLIPGLLGMNLMGGGLWGIGFVTVDMRLRKLLKRFLATPMKKRHFLLGMMISRMLFMVPEVILILVFARIAFGVVIYGSILSVVLLILLGSTTFAGVGLLVASRVRTLEGVSGLMNFVMLPMWLLSGIFFSAERFPSAVQPVIQLLPLTPLIDALRAVILEGATLASQVVEILILCCYALVTFTLSLWWFRWE